MAEDSKKQDNVIPVPVVGSDDSIKKGRIASEEEEEEEEEGDEDEYEDVDLEAQRLEVAKLQAYNAIAQTAIGGVKELLASPEVGKRIELWTSAKEKGAMASAKARTWSSINRTVLALAVLGAVVFLGAQGTIQGEALVGLLGALVGAFWSQRRPDEQKKE